ncbi:MAG: hypothetical protein IJT97_05450 [Bacteroidaceae bacterium]|nr:hypothetical protein [Bacteroidaceae bacterium]
MHDHYEQPSTSSSTESPLNEARQRLLTAIETAIGRKVRTPKDFDQLSAYIFEQTHQTISPTTLKRIWGYLPGNTIPRLTSLDILAQAIGHTDWETFCQQDITPERTAAPQPQNPITAKPSKKKRLLYVVLLSILTIFLATYYHHSFPWGKTKKYTNRYILKKGQTFKTSSEYLQLFGITSAERFWDQPLPHHEGIIIWGPEYQHNEWHNEGNIDSLMPTITEWWTPAGNSNLTKTSDTEDQLRTAERNANLYFTVMRTNEVRITFMKNLTDTSYVFLGIYRTNLAQSDSSHIVWERVADECDLSNLAYLQQLRH